MLTKLLVLCGEGRGKRRRRRRRREPSRPPTRCGAWWVYINYRYLQYRLTHLGHTAKEKKDEKKNIIIVARYIYKRAASFHFHWLIRALALSSIFIYSFKQEKNEEEKKDGSEWCFCVSARSLSCHFGMIFRLNKSTSWYVPTCVITLVACNLREYGCVYAFVVYIHFFSLPVWE